MQIYLIAAYAIFWLLPFILIVTIWIRQRRIEQEIAALEARLTE